MKIYILLIFILFFKTYSVIPIWDFPSQSIDLFASQNNQFIYTTYQSSTNDIKLKLDKIFIRGDDGIITYKNVLTIGSETKEVPFDDIESFYGNKLSCNTLICPKGKYHPYCFDSNKNITNSTFVENGNWELKCYAHDTGYFLVIYLMNGGNNILFYSKNNYELSSSNLYFGSNLYDFKLENGSGGINYKYKFPTLVRDGDYIRLKGQYLTMNSNENVINMNSFGDSSLFQAKSNSLACFDNSYYFYFCTYEDIYSFTFGFSSKYIDITNDETYKNSFLVVERSISTDSPFSFIDDMEIIDIKFTPEPKYLFYKILNKNNNKINYGIISIRTMKILYNLDEDIISINLYSNGDILAITSTSVYKLCILKNDDSCIDTCYSNNLILDTHGNKCQSVCDDGKIKLMPEGICIEKEECDLNFFILNNEGNECGLCNYFYPNDNKYKLINSTGCLNEIPDNAYIYNEKLNLLKCKLNYHLKESQCIPDFCYETCLTCFEISDDSNDQKCLTCKSGYILQDTNCFIKTEIPQITLTNEINCPKNYELIENICVECPNGCKYTQSDNCNCSECFDGYNLINNKCYEKNETLEIYYFYGNYFGKNESILIYQTTNLTNIDDILLEEIRKKINDGTIDTSLIDNGNYFLMESKRTKFLISLTDTQNEDIKTTIDLGECENKIKDNITSSSSSQDNTNLYLFSVEIDNPNMNAPMTGFEVYYKSEDNELTNIDLDICKNMKINKSVSIIIPEENIDKYNSSSGYYNDICYTTTTEKGTDITLKDRRDEYINNNMAVCEDNCDFVAYDTTNGKATCSCPILVTLSHISNFKLDKDKFKSKFIDIENIANVQIMKCYRLLFSDKIKDNYGSFIILSLLFIGIISIFLFYFHGYNILKKTMKNIFDAINSGIKEKGIETQNINTEKENKENNEDKKLEQKKENKKDQTKKKKKKKKKKNKIQNQNQNNHPPKKKDKTNNNKNNNNDSIIITEINNNTKINKNEKPLIKISNYLDHIELTEANMNPDKKISFNNSIMKYNDTELNLLPYQEALNIDNRTYFQYYLSLLKTKHLLFFSFFNSNDYNSRIIKLNLFLFTFAVNYTINALFFNDSTMHKIYEDEGEFNFVYQIPQILYSCIISSFILILVKMLALSEKHVLKIKSSKNDEISKIYKSETRKINIKFICFFIVMIIFLMAFWYYVGCFCAVYKNTQIHLISDTLISFGTSLLYPFVLYLIPGIFRIKALKNKDKNKETMYNVSKIIQLCV